MLDDGLKRPRLFEEVCGAGHNDELLCATELGERGAIERQHLDIGAADDQQRRSFYGKERSPSQVRAAATRNDRRDSSLMRRLRDKRRSRAGAGAEISDREIAGFHIPPRPRRRHQQALREQLNVENIAPVARLLDGQEFEQQGARPLSRRAWATKLLRGLSRPLPLPCANSTIPLVAYELSVCMR